MSGRYKLILMATDFSDCSKDALDHAIRQAQVFGSGIHLLHVFERPFISPAPESVKALEKIINEETQKLNTEAEKIREKNVEVHLMCLEGSPHIQILEAAEEVQADLIVMGTHGRTGMAHALIGSVAEEVVRTAPCPVLTVRWKKPPKSTLEGAAIPLWPLPQA